MPGSGRLRQHLPSVLKSFFSVRAGQINKHALLPQVRCLAASCHVTVLLQALQHVSNLEEEGLLSEEAASKLLAMLQETIQFWTRVALAADLICLRKRKLTDWPQCKVYTVKGQIKSFVGLVQVEFVLYNSGYEQGRDTFNWSINLEALLEKLLFKCLQTWPDGGGGQDWPNIILLKSI